MTRNGEDIQICQGSGKESIFLLDSGRKKKHEATMIVKGLVNIHYMKEVLK